MAAAAARVGRGARRSATSSGRRSRAPTARKRHGRERKARSDLERPLLDFVERLAHVPILDPACGSGNFLYVAINLLLDLEKEVIAYAAAHGLGLLPAGPARRSSPASRSTPTPSSWPRW